MNRIQVYAGGLVLGAAAAWVISKLVATIWPSAQTIVFALLVIIWLSGFVQILVRDLRAGSDEGRGVFVNPHEWDARELPREFRFISRGMSVREVVANLGAYTRVTPTGLLRFNLPSGGAIFLFINGAPADDAAVKGLQFYRTENDIPVGI
ncbi:MAG TPA: hypothetical protein VJ719_14045 [Chthoniobacterales bacterium]|nr:hypothetical protein [Chthoniobacterales bacterium]